MKVLFFWKARYLGDRGGMEKVLTDFANHIIEWGGEADITFYDPQKGDHPFFPLNNTVQLSNMADYLTPRNISSITGSQKIIREIIRIFSKKHAKQWEYRCEISRLLPAAKQIIADFMPDIIVSLEPRATALLFVMKKIDSSIILPPVITMCHFSSEYAMNQKNHEEINALENSMYVQVLLPREEEKIRRLTNGHAKVITIPNSVPQYKQQAELLAPKKKYRIINLARLNKAQKRQDVLIDAFARLSSRYPDWYLELWGEEQDGHSYTDQLKEKIHSYDLENRIFLKGATTDPVTVYLNSDIFAFPSAYEGFPLAMTEAMSAGLPVVAFKSCEAVADIIKSGKTGLLTEDGIDAFTDDLEFLMKNKNKRYEIGCSARQVMKQYEPSLIWEQWKKLLRQCT